MRALLLGLATLLLVHGAVDFKNFYSVEAQKDWLPWEQLPGAEEFGETASFRQFTGYITLNETSGKKYFYWFFESAQNPEQDPVVLWTNGGPGCSGLLGLFTELGPIRPLENGSLFLNPFAWNNYANMIFIEQPTGVGFSHSDTKQDYTSGDASAAADMYTFTQNWLKRFHRFRQNTFYIASESYGGHYMPNLAREIVLKNQQGKQEHINFKGFLVGNPYTDAFTNTVAQFNRFWGDSLIPKPMYDIWKSSCTERRLRNSNNDWCNALETKFTGIAYDINPYALDFPVCTGDFSSDAGRAQRSWLLNHIKNFTYDLRVAYQPCEANFLVSYLNRHDVKAAIRVPQNVVWTECSSSVNYSASDGLTPQQAIYNELIDGNYGLRILVFSGDDDSVCATEGTQDWIFSLGYEYHDLWKPWQVNDQTAGFVTTFQGDLTFVTVHSAGHEVPAYQPYVALELFRRFIDGSWFGLLE